MAVGEDVYCTLCMSDSYLPGAAVLAQSLRDAGTTKKLACLIDQERLRPSTVTELQSLYNYTIPIERIGNPNPANLYLMNRPDLLYTFTKINLWRLIQFRKIVYIDSDVVALRAPDELFSVEDDFAAAPDVGWPDAFNTGVMVLTPHMGDYWALRTLASAGNSFDGADQGLLNQYFEHKSWKRLSFAYNCTPSANYQYEPAYRYYKRDISMVHFIGRDKPWQRSRGFKGAPGAYQELLSRWWAVYDRHFKVSTDEYINTGRREPEVVWKAVREEVGRYSAPEEPKYYATGYPVETTPPAAPPPQVEPPTTATEIPFTEPGEEAENIDQGNIEPMPTADVRRFSAPHMDWDATRAAPPAESKPEAANFPTQTYEFSQDPAPFIPPAAYPEPPKDLWYEVPSSKPAEEKLAPLFPWEEREIPKPTRRFVEDEKPKTPPEPEPESELEFSGADELYVESSDMGKAVEPTTPTIKANDTWTAFSSSAKNAWDEVAGIEDYVRALTQYQKNRGNIEVHHNRAASSPPTVPASTPAAQTHILSPSNEPSAEDLIGKVAKRRESLILTDFPTAIERPSLPVTPAPRRRATFWGGDKDADGLEEAEGVPDQKDWDPTAQLEQLRRNSLIGPSDLKLPAKRVVPDRKMVSSSAPIMPEQDGVSSAAQGTSSGAVGARAAPAISGAIPAALESETMSGEAGSGKVIFSEPGFGKDVDVKKVEDLLSPTEPAAWGGHQ